MKQWLLLTLATLPLIVAGAFALLPTNSYSPQLPFAGSQVGSTSAPMKTPSSQAAASSGTSTAAAPKSAVTPSSATSASQTGGSVSHLGPNNATSPTQPPQTPSANSTATGNASFLMPPNAPLNVFPKAALDLAAITGRRIIPASEAENQRPYSSVGRFFNQNASRITVGTGVLIHADVVLTAAHVIENVMQREETFGPPCFQVPGMKPVLVGDAELDAGWRSKNVTADIGVCKLDNLLYPALPIQRTEFETEEEALFGTTVVSLGYDLDIWMACGCPDFPPLVERSGAFEPFPHGDGNKLDRFLTFMDDYKKIADPLKNLVHLPEEDENSAGRMIDGIALVAGTYGYLHENTNSQYGWKSEMIGSLGCDGGPVISNHRVVGVMGYPNGDTIGPLKITVGHLLGTRLTHVVADMVEDFQ